MPSAIFFEQRGPVAWMGVSGMDSRVPAAMGRRVRQVILWLFAFSFGTPVGTQAAQATLAVATNFLEPANQLVADATTDTPHRLTIVSGSTGKLFAQIIAGAPFDLFLSADQDTPAKLIAEGLAEPSSRSTYAVGRLVLWSRETDRLSGTQEDAAALLASGAFRHLAIANPDVAPYGAAARATLQTLGLWQQLQSRIVMSPNIGDVFLQTLSGGADIGLIAASSLSTSAQRNLPRGSWWQVPEGLHPPILQDVVLMKRATNNEAAVHFLKHLESEPARAVIEAAGYAAPTATHQEPR